MVVLAELTLSLMAPSHCPNPSNEQNSHPSRHLFHLHLEYEQVKIAEEILGIFSHTILCIFVLEYLAYMVAFSWKIFDLRYWKGWAHLFDFAVIITSIVLGLVFHSEEAESILIILRLWR